MRRELAAQWRDCAAKSVMVSRARSLAGPRATSVATPRAKSVATPRTKSAAKPRTLLWALGLVGVVILLAGCAGLVGRPPPTPTRLSTALVSSVALTPAAPPMIRHELTGRTDCLTCHATGLPADHAGREARACQGCHVPAPRDIRISAAMSPPQIPHELRGRADCLMCHKLGVGKAPRYPDDHAGRTNAVCQTCHGALATALLEGRQLFQRVCARCHGEAGEGGIGPALNSKPFLDEHDDASIRQAIISGRGASGMLSWGDLGLLTDEQIDELVSYIRSWAATAPAVAPTPRPPSAAEGSVNVGGDLFAQFCSGCHGVEGERQAGNVVLSTPGFLEGRDDTALAETIRDGGRAMPPFHAMLTTQDISDLLAFMRSWATAKPGPPGAPSFANDILPIFQSACGGCHGTLGNWTVGTRDQAVNGGDHGPTVLPGNPADSLLVQKLRGTQTIGGPMPLAEPLPEEQIALVEAWIAAGAPDN